MSLFFVSNFESAFYKSNAFGRCIDYAATHIQRCELAEVNGKRRMVVRDVPDVATAVSVLNMIIGDKRT